MSRYKPPTIAEQGGLNSYLTGLGINYQLFRSLRSSIGDRYKTIADALTKDAKLRKDLRPGRVKNWCRVDDEEMEEQNHAV